MSEQRLERARDLLAAEQGYYVVVEGMWVGPMDLDVAREQAATRAGLATVRTANERAESREMERQEGVATAFTAVGLGNVRRVSTGLYAAPSFILRQDGATWRATWREGAHLAAGPGTLVAVAAEMAAAIATRRHW